MNLLHKLIKTLLRERIHFVSNLMHTDSHLLMIQKSVSKALANQKSKEKYLRITAWKNQMAALTKNANVDRKVYKWISNKSTPPVTNRVQDDDGNILYNPLSCD